MGPELVGLKANEWTYKRGIYDTSRSSFPFRPPNLATGNARATNKANARAAAAAVA